MSTSKGGAWGIWGNGLPTSRVNSAQNTLSAADAWRQQRSNNNNNPAATTTNNNNNNDSNSGTPVSGSSNSGKGSSPAANNNSAVAVGGPLDQSQASSATDPADEVIPTPASGVRRDGSPDSVRTGSPFNYLRDPRHLQATAAQAAAMAPNGKGSSTAFLDLSTANFGLGSPQGTAGKSNDGQNDGSASRLKSVFQNAMDEEAFADEFGPMRANSTPPYASSKTFGGPTNGAAPPSTTSGSSFFTPQVAQRAHFEQPGGHAEPDLSSAMRGMNLNEQRYDAPGPASRGFNADSPTSYNPYSVGPISYSGQSAFNGQNDGFQSGGFGYNGRQYDDFNPGPNYGMIGDSSAPPGQSYYGADGFPYDGRGARPYRQDDFQRQNFRGPGGRFGPPSGDRRQMYMGGMDYNRNMPPVYASGASFYRGGGQMMYGGPHGVPGVGRREDPSAGLRSPLLEEFRNNKSKRFELRDIIGHVVEFSGDQHGSRFIQQKLETANSDDKDEVFQEIMPNCLQLMTDVFGNYVIQKFFEHGSQVQKTCLAQKMEGHVLSLTLQMYGCRVVQKALEHVLADQQDALIKELDGQVLKCVKDQNGNHVIQKALERLPEGQVKFIIDAFQGQGFTLATHTYGCRVIQRLLEHCPTAASSVLEELHRYTQNLVVDQYGNYVSQHILEHGQKADKSRVIEVVKGQVLTLSKHKFASNVVEKCIAYGTVEERQDIIDEIITSTSEGQSALAVLMKDQYGNYVLQKMLEVADGAQRAELVQKIRPILDSLKKFSYGKHLSSIERLLDRDFHHSAAAAYGHGHDMHHYPHHHQHQHHHHQQGPGGAGYRQQYQHGHHAHPR